MKLTKRQQELVEGWFELSTWDFYDMEAFDPFELLGYVCCRGPQHPEPDAWEVSNSGKPSCWRKEGEYTLKTLINRKNPVFSLVSADP